MRTIKPGLGLLAPVYDLEQSVDRSLTTSKKRASSGYEIVCTSHSHAVVTTLDTLGNLVTLLLKTMARQYVFLCLILLLIFNTGCFFKCPRPRCRRPRCPAASNCCDGTSVSSIAASYAEQVTSYWTPTCSLFFFSMTFPSLLSLTPNYTKVILRGCVTLRWYVSRSMIQDQRNWWIRPGQGFSLVAPICPRDNGLRSLKIRVSRCLLIS